MVYPVKTPRRTGGGVLAKVVANRTAQRLISGKDRTLPPLRGGHLTYRENYLLLKRELRPMRRAVA